MADKMQWFVLQVMSGHELKVQRTIQQRIAIADSELQAMFGDVIVPTEEVVEMRGGKKHTSDRKFFPSYVLLNMDMNDQSWHFINKVPGVLKFIGGKNNQPTPISEAEMNRIVRRVESGEDKPQPKTLYEVGEVVRVMEGPFADFDGVVEEINYDKSRMKVSVTIFGRATPVELSFTQVQKV
jgi:transcriptional antiterminator NusG